MRVGPARGQELAKDLPTPSLRYALETGPGPRRQAANMAKESAASAIPLVSLGAAAKVPYSITSSARASTAVGTVSPSVPASSG
jgi:hypothetical protein